MGIKHNEPIIITYVSTTTSIDFGPAKWKLLKDFSVIDNEG